MPSTYAVCQEILRLGKERKPAINDISPMKLIKLVYISHGINLAVLGKPLFNEDVMAWQYGPVIVSIYEKVKKYKRDPIHPDEFGDADAEEDMYEGNRKAIECAMDIYGELEAGQLSKIIPNEDIRKHYREILRIS